MAPHPAWLSSPYGPVIEIGYPYELGPEYRWNAARWDTTGRWGPWWQWRRVDCDVRRGAVVRGASSPSARISSATASISMASHDATLAPWYRDPATGERLNRANLPFRVAVQNDAGTQWPLFTGWIDTWFDQDDPTDPGIAITASDGFKLLSESDTPERPAAGAGEAAGARISRVLDNAQWTAGRELSGGTIALQATTLAQPALEECYLVADTEGGHVWIDVDGRFRFVDRTWLRQRGESVRWRISDGTDPDAVCASAIHVVADDMAIQNVIGISRIGGTASWLEDPASIAKYGRHTWSRFDLPYQNDNDTPTILAIQLDDRTDRDYYVSSIVLSPLVETAAWPIALDVELGDSVYLTRTRSGTTFYEFATVMGIDYAFGPSEFMVVLSLGPRLRQTNARWDQGLWDVALWSAT